MDRRETARYLGRLYKEGDEFEVAYIAPGMRTARVVRTYGEPGSGYLEKVLDEMERGEANGYNVYVSVMPTRLHNSGSYDRVWVDQDDPSAPWPFGADPDWDSPAWPKPSTLVKTSEEVEGFRWQAIWLLDDEVPEAEAREAMRRLAARSGADGSVHDSRRLLRVPGILNAKRGSAARLIDTSSGTTNLGAFKLPEDSAVDALLTMQVQNPQHVLGEWLQGVPEGDRARKAYVCARFLKACEVRWEDAGAILKVGALRCDPTFSDHDLEHALNSAYHRN